jgi:hypothetical protein
MTAHPEITGPLGEFETCPVWVPGMDSGERIARIALKTIPVHRFDQRPTEPQKFETYPDWGAKLKLLNFALPD